MSDKTPYERLEIAFIEFLEDAVLMRKEQKEYHEHRSYNVNRRLYREKLFDQDLASIGVDENTDFKTIKLTFIEKVTPKDKEVL